MKSNTFNSARFGLLWKQNIVHQHKFIFTSLVGFCGAVFILLWIIQFLQDFQPVPQNRFFSIFLAVFFGAGVICAGTAFPALRSKEKSFSYFMNPASILEKFLYEFITRVLLFIILIPLLYWAVYSLEANVVKLFYRGFKFDIPTPFSFPQLHLGSDSFMTWAYTLIVSLSFLIFVLAFTGATVFVSNPVVKTLFSVAIIFFFNLFLVYFFARILQWRGYQNPTGSILFLKDGQDLVVFCAIVCIAMNLGFITAAYLKLKEREV